MRVKGPEIGYRKPIAPRRLPFATFNLLWISHMEFLGLITDLVFGTPKTLAVPSYKYARLPETEHKRRRIIRLDLPAAPPRMLLHHVRRRAPAIRRAGLRNLILSDPALGEGE
jgi:hypothetical protein